MPAFLALQCHPQTPADSVGALGVALAREADGGLALTFRLEGELAALRIPADGELLPVERLWAYTCFELFAAAPAGSAGSADAAYREFNFSPSGQSMRFDFDAYRLRRASPPALPRSIVTRSGAGWIELATRLAAGELPAGDFAIGLSAVVLHADGSHSYWALRHPPGKPDFHHRDCFALAMKAAQS